MFNLSLQGKLRGIVLNQSHKEFTIPNNNSSISSFDLNQTPIHPAFRKLPLTISLQSVLKRNPVPFQKVQDPVKSDKTIKVEQSLSPIIQGNKIDLKFEMSEDFNNFLDDEEESSVPNPRNI